MTKAFNICRSVMRLAMFVSIGLILGLMLLTSADVILRYAFSKPIRGAAEIGGYVLMLITFLGLAYTQFKGRHIRVELLRQRFHPRIEIILDSFVLLLLAALFLVAAWESGGSAWYFYQRGEIEWNVPFPTWPLRFVAPLGFLLIFIEVVLEFFSNIIMGSGRKGLL